MIERKYDVEISSYDDFRRDFIDAGEKIFITDAEYIYIKPCDDFLTLIRTMTKLPFEEDTITCKTLKLNK